MFYPDEMKKLAVKQMRAAADLYEVCEKAECALTDDDHYNKMYLRAQRTYRYERMKHLLGLKPTREEEELWDNIMQELD